MFQQKQYQQAIDLIVEGVNLTNIMVNLAKSNPGVFVSIVQNQGNVQSEMVLMDPKSVGKYISWMYEAGALLLNKTSARHPKVEAIKIVRSNTGFGLREAKEVIDAICHDLLNWTGGRLSLEAETKYLLNSWQVTVANDILSQMHLIPDSTNTVQS